jgi:hypothetical protein
MYILAVLQLSMFCQKMNILLVLTYMGHVHNSGSQNQVRLLLLLFFFERCILFSLFLVFLSVWQLAAACHSQNFSLDTTFSFKKK